MEKDIRHDRLDDFVQKSFEDYEENPAHDMWDRIEPNLPGAEDRKPVWYVWRAYRWPLGAALAILLLVSRMVYMQCYYEEKLRTLSGQATPAVQNATPAPATATAVPMHIPVENKEVVPIHALGEVENMPLTRSVQQPVIESNGTSHQISSQQFVSKSMATTTATPARNQPETETTAAASWLPINETPLLSAVDIPKTAMTSELPTKLASFNALEHRTPALSFTHLAQPAGIALPIKKHKSTNGWYTGVSVTPHVVVEKTGTPRRRMMLPRQLYASMQQHAQVSANVSLCIGKEIAPRFSVESGLGFQQLSRTAIHRPGFEYREGHPIQNTGGAESKSFDYDLNTYGGSASVSLRTEVQGSEVPTENERVVARITSHELIQLAHIPLLGVAKLGNGRTQAVIKAGIVGSYILENQFSISTYTLENAKLRFRGSDGYTVQFNRPQHFIFGYQVSVGAAFRLSRNLSLVVAPTLSGDFPRIDSLQGKLPGQSMFGVNLGVNWGF